MFKALLVILIVIGLGLLFFGAKLLPSREIVAPGSVDTSTAVTASTTNLKTYTNNTLGIEFAYPNYYHVEAKEIGTAERKHYSVVFTEDTEENRKLREGKISGAEGPVEIAFDFYQNNLDKQSLLDWVKNTSASNFKLGTGDYATQNVGGAEAIAYQWSGLHEADNLVWAHKGNIVSAAVTFLNQDDRIRGDFYDMIQTIRLY